MRQSDIEERRKTKSGKMNIATSLSMASNEIISVCKKRVSSLVGEVQLLCGKGLT
jgi:hypothetical protein